MRRHRPSAFALTPLIGVFIAGAFAPPVALADERDRPIRDRADGEATMHGAEFPVTEAFGSTPSALTRIDTTDGERWILQGFGGEILEYRRVGETLESTRSFDTPYGAIASFDAPAAGVFCLVGPGADAFALFDRESNANPADLDGDGEVGGSDLGILLGAWGTSDPTADIDGNGIVDGADLALLLGAFGA